VICAPTNTGTRSSVRFDGDRVIWNDSRSGVAQTYCYDLATQETAVLPQGGAVSGPLLVDTTWNPQQQISGYDIDKGVSFRVRPQREPFFMTTHPISGVPSISGHQIAYLWTAPQAPFPPGAQPTSVNGTRYVLVTDLERDITFPVCTTATTASPLDKPLISGDRVLWNDTGVLTGGTYLATFTPTLADWGPGNSVTIAPQTTSSPTLQLTLAASSPAAAVQDMSLSASPWPPASGSAQWQPFSASATYTLPPGEGSRSVYVRFRDAHGNVSPRYTASIDLVDDQPPVTAVQGTPVGWDTGWVSQEVTLTFVPDDVTESVTHYQVNDGTPVIGQTYKILAKSDHFNDGPYTITYYSVDAHSQQETPTTCSVMLDTRAPNTVFSAEDFAGAASRDTGLRAADARTMRLGLTAVGRTVVRLRPKDVDLKGRPASGVQTTKYRVNSGSWHVGKTVTLRAPASGTKKYVVRYYSVDKVGHKEAVHAKVVYVRSSR